MTQPIDEDELTALIDADIPRVDLVDKGANGVPRFLIAKRADGATGLLDPDYVRDLIAKADPAPATEDTVTMTGSPAAIAHLIHGAAVRPVAKAKYNADDLRRMAANGEAMRDGNSYPIADRDDLDKAIRAVGRGGADHDAIRRHVITRARSLGAESEIPDNWNADGSLKGDVTKESSMADDLLDAASTLAEPEEAMPGADTTPSSPAWEAVDAATARKWTAILARAKAAVSLLAEREVVEAAAGECDDASVGIDLDDAACAIEYAIGVLAPFAVEEQAEAEAAADELNGVRKALGDFDPQALDTIEALGSVRKAGRVLSSANEAAIRGAVDSLQKVLASLPQAPTVVEKRQHVRASIMSELADAVAKRLSRTLLPKTVEKSGQPVADTKEGTVTEPVAKTDPTPAEPQAPATPDVPAEPVAKADGDVKPQMVAVYNAGGKLVGVVDPTEITPIAGADAPDDKADGDAAAEPAAEPAATPDLTPAPPAEVGTPADAVPDDVNKTQTLDTDTVAKALAAAVTEHLNAATATQGEHLAEMAGVVKALQDRIDALEEQPAPPRVFTNGAVPSRDQMRGQDRGAAPVDVAKAREVKKSWYEADGASQDRIANEMQASAIDLLAAIHKPR